MNQLQFMLSMLKSVSKSKFLCWGKKTAYGYKELKFSFWPQYRYFKMFKQQAVLLCIIASICLLNTNALAAMTHQSPTEQQAIQVSIGEAAPESLKIPQGRIISIPVTIENVSEEILLGAMSANIYYDPIFLQPVECITNPSESWNIALCNHKDKPGIILMNGLSISGLSGSVDLALLEFHALGEVGSKTDLELDITQVVDVDGNEIPSIGQNSSVEITDASSDSCVPTSTTVCSEYTVYLPAVLR